MLKGKLPEFTKKIFIIQIMFLTAVIILQIY